jgi:hypothetical protein
VNRRGISRSGASIPLLVGAVLAVGAVAVVAQTLGGDGRTAAPPPSTPTQVADPFDHVCQTLSEELQVLRVDQLQRAADSLEEDAAALRELGERSSAVAVEDVVAAVHTYREVANGGGDTQAASEEFLLALDAIDWCP